MGALFVIVIRLYDPYLLWQISGQNRFIHSWVLDQNLKTKSHFSKDLRSESSKRDAQFVEDLRINYGRKLKISPRIEIDHDFPGCQKIVVDGLPYEIESKLLQKLVHGECVQRIQEFVFSDDLKKFAIELRHWNQSGTATLIVGSFTEGAIVVEVQVDGVFRNFIFNSDGHLLYKNLANRGSSCEIEMLSQLQFACALDKAILKKNGYAEVLGMQRLRHDGTVWLKAKGGDGKLGILRWESSVGKEIPEKILDTSLSKIRDFKIVTGGLFIEQESSKMNEGLASSDLLFITTPEMNLNHLLHAPTSNLSWQVNGESGTALVKEAGANGENGEFSLFKLTQVAATKLKMNFDKSLMSDISLWGNGQILMQNLAGESYIGHFNGKEEFHIDLELKYPFKLQIEKFEGLSSDGTSIPCTKVSRFPQIAQTGTVIEAYGAYGKSLKLRYNGIHATLLSEGVTIILAHARGGGELGSAWHLGGKGRNKINTVADVYACTQAAIKNKFAFPQKIIMLGQSAGAIPAMNLALDHPEIVAGAWVDVPFLDSANKIDNKELDDQEFGALSSDQEETIRRGLSPYFRLLQGSSAKARFLLTCGEDDDNTPLWQCTKSFNAIKERHPRKTAFLFTLVNQGHYAGAANAQAELDKNYVVENFILSSFKADRPE